MHHTDNILLLPPYLALPMATLKELHDINCVVGGDPLLIHGDICARIAYRTDNRIKIRRLTPVSACLWAMDYSSVETTETQGLFKGQCFLADDAPKQCLNG
jgi:hypothetical protein